MIFQISQSNLRFENSIVDRKIYHGYVIVLFICIFNEVIPDLQNEISLVPLQYLFSVGFFQSKIVFLGPGPCGIDSSCPKTPGVLSRARFVGKVPKSKGFWSGAQWVSFCFRIKRHSQIDAASEAFAFERGP